MQQFLKTSVEVAPTSPVGSTMTQYIPFGPCDYRCITVIRGDKKQISETEFEEVPPYAYKEYIIGRETKRREPLVLEGATKTRKSVIIPKEVPMFDMEGKPVTKGRPTQFFQVENVVTYVEYNSPKITGEDLKRLLAFLESNLI